MRDVNQREPMFTRTINSQFKLHVAQRAVNFTPILPCNPAFALHVDTLFNPVENVLCNRRYSTILYYQTFLFVENMKRDVLQTC